MPLAIIIIAIVLIAAGIRGSYKDLATLLTGEFTGDSNFLNWLAAIAIVGALGYVPALQRFSRMFLGLILVVVFLKDGGGVFDQLVSAIQGSSADVAHPNPGNPSAANGSDSGILGGILNAFGVKMPSLPSGNFVPSAPSATTLPNGTTNPAAAASGNLGTSIIPDNGSLMGP